MEKENFSIIEIPEWTGDDGKKYLPTFKKGDMSIVIKMLEPIDYEVPGKNILLRLTKGKTYYVPNEIAKELSEQGKCYYTVRPEDLDLPTHEGEKEKWILVHAAYQ